MQWRDDKILFKGLWVWLFAMVFLFSIQHARAADKKISDLNSLGQSSWATGDLFPIVDISASETKKTTVGDFDLRFLGINVIVPIAQGGTGATTANGGFNALSPMTTLGDLTYEDATPKAIRLPGNTTSTKKFLSQTGTGSASAAPSWLQPACGDLSNAAASCSTDATNASNIGSGTLPAARLPNPSSSTLGGIESYAAVSNQWINAISTGGVPSSTQPAFSNISGSCTVAQGCSALTSVTIGDIIYGSASNVWSALAGNITTTKKFLTQTGTGAASQAPSWAQPACADLSNAAASCSTDATNASNIGSGTLPAGRLPNPSASTLGGIESLASTSHQWINTISTSGVPSSTQPAFSDISGNLATAQLPSAQTWPASGTVQATTPNNHGVMISGAGATATVIAPDASTSKILMSGGASADPTWGTIAAGSNITVTPTAGTLTIAASSSATPAYTYGSQTSTLNPAVLGHWYKFSGASFTTTLPDATAANAAGQDIIFEHDGTSLTQVYCFATTSAQTITGPGGAVASGNYCMFTNGERLRLGDDGAGWQVLEHKTENGETDSGALVVTASSAYTFTLSATATITAGTVYTANGNTFIVSTASSASTTLLAYGTGSPGASGTLTFVSGSPSGNKTFNSVATAQPAFGTVTYNRFVWSRTGRFVNVKWDYSATGIGTSGTGMLGFYYPTGLLPDETNVTENTAVLAGAHPVTPSLLGQGWSFGSGVTAYSFCYNNWPTLFSCYATGNGAWNPTDWNIMQATSRFTLSFRYPVGTAGTSAMWQP